MDNVKLYEKSANSPIVSDWSHRGSLGIVVVLGITLSAANTVSGLAQALVVLVGVVVALLWIGNFLVRGYNESMND